EEAEAGRVNRSVRFRALVASRPGRSLPRQGTTDALKTRKEFTMRSEGLSRAGAGSVSGSRVAKTGDDPSAKDVIADYNSSRSHRELYHNHSGLAPENLTTLAHF